MLRPPPAAGRADCLYINEAFILGSSQLAYCKIRAPFEWQSNSGHDMHGRCLSGGKLGSRLRDRFADERGSATIENVIWLPVFLLFFAIIVDGTMIFSNRSMILRVVQDANRGFALGRLKTETATQDYVYNRIKAVSPTASVKSTDSGGTITTQVTAPASDFDAIGLFGVFASVNLSVRAQQLTED